MLTGVAKRGCGDLSKACDVVKIPNAHFLSKRPLRIEKQSSTTLKWLFHFISIYTNDFGDQTKKGMKQELLKHDPT